MKSPSGGSGVMATIDYFSELEAMGSNTVNPSPGTSVYHTPRASMSRRPSSRRDISGTSSRSRGTSVDSSRRAPSSSPPPLPNSSARTTPNDNNDSSAGDDISLLDPRRFTPTLHASLVSEILNLRRELDSKHKFIEDLEVSLQSSKSEKDEVAEQLALSEKERRSVKRQFSQLENSTLSALEELAKDRDGVKKVNGELRLKLDDAQEKLKKREDESNRTHAAWEKEQNAWETERRAFERRVHITETRLKTVLAELEAAHHMHAQMQEQHGSGEEDDNTKDSGLGDESDSASQASPRLNGNHQRSSSSASRRSFGRYRYSVQSVTGADGLKLNGISLADELQLDEEDEDRLSEPESEYQSQEMVAKKVVIGRNSQHFDHKPKRTSILENRRTLQPAVEFSPKPSGNRESAVEFEFKPVVTYVDTGIQFTPPPSPQLKPATAVQVSPDYCDAGVQYDKEPEPAVVATNEVRKDSKFDDYPVPFHNRIPTPPLLVDRGQQMSPVPPAMPSPKKTRTNMVSAGSQTLDHPLSPPATPSVSPPLSPTEVVPVHLLAELKSISTQTDFPEEQRIVFTQGKRPVPLLIPSITITSPPSAPSSPKEPKLPPGTKNIACQTGADLVCMKSVSIQTEEIRIDTRLAKLPPHLHPAAIAAKPPTYDALKSRPSVKKKTSLGSNFSERPAYRSPSNDEVGSSPPMHAPIPVRKVEIPGTSEAGPSGSERPHGLQRLLRSGVLAPAFGSDDRLERDDLRPEHMENEPKVATFSTPSMSSRTLKHLRSLGGTRPSPVPEERDEYEHSPESYPPRLDQGMMSAHSVTSGRSSIDTGASGERSKGGRAISIKSGSSKQPSMRRSAMVQNGNAAAHRSRTPSIASVGSSSYFSQRSVGPPFPVPDRGSSRKLFASRSEGSTSPTPRTGLFGSRRRGNAQIMRKDSLRKVRSATVIQRSNSRGRNRSRSPPLDPQQSNAVYPPLPKDNVAMPAKVYPSQKSGEKRLSRAMSPNNKPELSRASQGTVVDAIAATMVGEWMWKYVRRRTSFGVPESPQDQLGRPGTDGSVNVTGNGVRHRRWVWLSPYERAIMWSSKQPASNSALLGKSGRKLVIQSVLDVRDDTPLPKNHGIAEPFNRSILILTPARALKFTATSQERHYTWLTALSFLAHSPLLAPGLAALPPPPQEPHQDELPPPRGRNSTTLKRGPIRDSVRVARDRARPVKTPRSASDRGQQPAAAAGTIPEIEFEAAFGRSAPPMPELPPNFGGAPVGGAVAMGAAAAALAAAAAPAEAPSVPRFAAHHGRNRSLTGPSRFASGSSSVIPAALRSLTYKEVPAPAFSSGPSAVAASMPTAALPSLPSPTTVGSGRTSVASTAARSNFLEAVGTIRMEAFIDGRDTLWSGSNGPGSVGTPSPTLGGQMGFGGGRRRGGQSPREIKRGGMILGDDFDISGIGGFDPFKDFAAH